jgi:hypothetical protein
MGKSRACGFDIFALNDIIDTEKLSVLYQASLTECAPNDPFNDWSKIVESIINIYLDIIDRINNENVDIEINDEISDYDGNYVIDDWEIIRFVSDVIDVLNDDVPEIEFIDSDDYIFEEFVLTDEWEEVLYQLNSDFIDMVIPDLEFQDDVGENVLEDYFEDVYFNVIDNIEIPVDIQFEINNEDFWEFNIIDGGIIDNLTLDIIDSEEGDEFEDNLINDEYEVVLF